MNNAKKIILTIICSLTVSIVNGEVPVINFHSYLECFQGKSGNLEKTQIWNITAGNDDYMFFASNEGLGVFDGVRWEINKDEDDDIIIRSLYFDTKNNILYCGAVNQFGKWEMNEYGKFRYTPLWKNMRENVYTEFWRVGATGNNIIYFQSHQEMFRYDTRTQLIDTIGTSENYHYMQIVSGDVYIQENKELFKLDIQNKFHKVVSVNDRIMNMFQREKDGNLLLFFEHKGIFILSEDFNSLTPLNEKTNGVLTKYKIFSVKKNDKTGQYLIGTTRGGLFIIDPDGLIVNNIGENEGLPSSTVLSVATDNRNNIWMGLDGGVATLDVGESEVYCIPRPFIGNIRQFLHWNDYIYIASNQGLFRLDKEGNCSLVEGTSGSVWGVYNIRGEVVFTHDLGVFQLKNNSPVCIREGGVMTLVQSTVDPSYYIGGNYHGFSLYHFTDGKLKYIGELKNYAGTARYIQFDKLGYLWIMIPREGFARLTLSMDKLSVEDIKMFPVTSSRKEFMMMTILDDNLIFYDGNEPYHYNISDESLSPDVEAAEIFNLCGKDLTYFKQFDTNLWYQTKGDIGYIIRKGNSLEKHAGIFFRIYNKRISPFMIKLDIDTYGIGFQNGIALYKLNEKPSNAPLKIRMLEAHGVGEPVYYNFKNGILELPNNKRLINLYPVNMNSNCYVEYRIMEIDPEWKTEKISNYLSLTNLESGTYTIQIRNAGDTNVEPENVIVDIDRPWYAGTPMICVYAAFLIGIIFLIALFFRQRNKKERLRIEKSKQEELEKLEKENLIQSQQISELEKEKLKIELDEKNKRLAFITMNGVKRSNLMNELKSDILEINQTGLQPEVKQKIKNAVRKIEFELDNNDDWEIFEKYFNVVFGGLLEKLIIKYPQLTNGDLKLLAYIKLNLNNKEIANLLNISYRSVETAKYRLRKKLDLNVNSNFNSILNMEEGSE